MKKLYNFEWEIKRGGEIEGLFIADDQTIKEAMGKDVYFGEILGKPFEVYGTLDVEDLTVITDDPEHIAMLEEIFDSPTISGYNPLQYMNEEED